ncbi:hypothetical protein [Pedobacter psychroterrae]|uniref:DoxX-like protein n=1 Tax=Pedobacter psychroterrae TaxID=2530453 RepID=A0A4R0NI73_9SPHI|nr:hypothetical protein [Pedobacter psychroterrae]TCD00312.1 hypothetical protein EZ437_13875 [Pedobacter psychroterrae]
MKLFPAVPSFVKFLAWICLIWSGMFFVTVGYSFFNEVEFSWSSFKTNNLLSPLGMLIVSFWLMKGLVSYGLLKGEIWAYKLGLIDAAASTFLYIVAAIHPFIYFNPEATRTLNFSEILFFLVYFLFMRSRNQYQLAQQQIIIHDK